MDAIQRLPIERECERLIHTYCHVIDHGEAGRVAEPFTADGVRASLEVTAFGRLDGLFSTPGPAGPG